MNPKQRTEVIDKTQYWVGQASQLFDRQLPNIEVLFDLKGRTSGMFCVRGQRQWIRFNPWIFAKYYQQSLSVTIPHEVAHYACYQLHGKARHIKPHGKEWKAIMNAFGVDASVTCQLDISDLPQKRLNRHIYQCACRRHELTSIRHNRIQRGLAQYACPVCRETLTYLPN